MCDIQIPFFSFPPPRVFPILAEGVQQSIYIYPKSPKAQLAISPSEDPRKNSLNPASTGQRASKAVQGVKGPMGFGGP